MNVSSNVSFESNSVSVFTKSSRSTNYMFRILFTGDKERESRESQHAIKILERYDLTVFEINGVSIKIKAFDGSSDSWKERRGHQHFRPPHASVHFLGSTNEYSPVSEWPNTVYILACKKMNDAQREKLKNLPSNFSIVEYNEDSDFLLKRTIEKIMEISLVILPKIEEAPSAALAAQSAPGQRSLMGDCTIQ